MFEQNIDIKKNCLKLISIYHQRSDSVERKQVLTGLLQKRNAYLRNVFNQSRCC